VAGSFGTRCQDSFGFVDIAVAALEFSFEADCEVGEIDQVPAGEIPAAIRFRRVLEADEEVDGVFAHFVRRDPGFEVERAEAAVAAAGGVELGIEIDDAVRR